MNPKLPAAHHWYAWFLVQQGRPDAAAEQIEQARKLGPDQVVIANNAGKIAYLRRDYLLAIKKHQYALELSPDFRKAHRDLALVYAETGKLDESLRELRRAKGLTDDGRDLLSVQAYAFARNGHARQAHQLLAQLEPLADRKPLAYDIAAVYAALGEKDRAFDWLRRAFQNTRPAGPDWPSTRDSTVCTAIRGSRRSQDLDGDQDAGLGMPRHATWQPTGFLLICWIIPLAPSTMRI